MELEPFGRILQLKDPLQRDFYAEMCRIEALERADAASENRRNALLNARAFKKPEILVKRELAKLRREDTLSPDLVFRDPYFLDFLGLKDAYSEKDLETAILREMEQFILELGAGFSFVARQKHIVIDGEDFYLDLLFYHGKLRRLVAVDLKRNVSRRPIKGRWGFYLGLAGKARYGARRRDADRADPAVDKGDEQIELLHLDKSGIRIASYLTDLPPGQLLQRKLHDTMVAGGPGWKAD